MSDRKVIVVSSSSVKGTHVTKPVVGKIATPKVSSKVATPNTPVKIVADGYVDNGSQFQKTLLDVQYKRDGVNEVVLPPDPQKFQYIPDSVSKTDSLTKNTGKNFSELLGTVDGIVTMGLRKLLIDAVQCTDDFYGAASADDDQYAAFTKVVVEGFDQTDTFSYVWAASRSFVEAMTCADNKDWEFTANKANAVGSDDSIITFKLFNAIFDVESVSDLLVVDITKPFTDTFSKVDVMTLNPGKVFVEALASAEVYTFDHSLGKVDLVVTSEAFNKDISKPLSDAVSDTDVTTMAVAIAKAEAVSKSDSGKVLMQSYVTPRYLADDYVGSSTSF